MEKQYLYIMFHSFLCMDIIVQSWCHEEKINCSHKQDTSPSNGKITINASANTEIASINITACPVGYLDVITRADIHDSH